MQPEIAVMEDLEPEKEYKVGDVVWVVDGYSRDGLIGIRCTIREVDDSFRKRDSRARLFYWVDEPVGHGLACDDFYETREEAEEELKLRADHGFQFDGDDGWFQPDATLEDCRKNDIKFIVSTHTHLNSEEKEQSRQKLAAKYPQKKRGEEWFNLNDIGYVPPQKPQKEEEKKEE